MSPSEKRSLFSWCLFDWANTAFSTVIITFIYSVYFTRTIAGDETQGSAWWSYAIAFSGVIIAVLGPLLGAVADHSRDRKRWTFVFSMICIVCTALLWFGEPDQTTANVVFVLGLIILANVGFEMAQVFNNAMLLHIAPPHMIGRVSGWAWGLGYAGGLFCLALALFGLIGIGGVEPFLPISGADSANVRASGPLTALWFFVFMIPLFLYTKDVERSPMKFREAVQSGVTQLTQTLRQVRHHKNLMTFLVASALYRDGLNTLFMIGGVYAAGELGMDFTDIIFFAIALNISAGLGAVLFAHIDDKMGSRITTILSLYGLIFSGLALLFVEGHDMFIAMSMVLGLFIGPAQAASRTLAGRLAPAGMVGQTYGLYAFTGKTVSFLGPLMYGVATTAFASQKAGLMTIILLWSAGLALLTVVREERP